MSESWDFGGQVATSDQFSKSFLPIECHRQRTSKIFFLQK
jgi:hypothetical protein